MIATITILGKKYTGEGKTAQEAIGNLNYKGFAKTKALLTVSDGEKEKTIVLYPAQTQRLFAPQPLTKEIAVKQTALRF